MRTILAVFVLLLAFCGTAVAGSWEDGSTAFEQGDKAAAARIWRPLAEQGDLRTQVMLVFMYAEGKGVPQDYAEAITWYRRAVEQGHAAAQNNLGVIYAKGLGVPQDFVLAHVWYNLAAARHSEPEMRKNSSDARDKIAARMTPAQVAKAQQLAAEWQPKPGV